MFGGIPVFDIFKHSVALINQDVKVVERRPPNHELALHFLESERSPVFADL